MEKIQGRKNYLGKEKWKKQAQRRKKEYHSAKKRGSLVKATGTPLHTGV